MSLHIYNASKIQKILIIPSIQTAFKIGNKLKEQY